MALHTTYVYLSAPNSTIKPTIADLENMFFAFS